jgi:2-dehydro-3-deoxy-D-arabinonate dehydratase
MILYNTTGGPVLEDKGRYSRVPVEWDDLFTRPDPARFLRSLPARTPPSARKPGAADLRPPVGSQEVWGAGVTYNRSRVARMSESRHAGGSDFYDRVYHAVRPELFFKASPHRVVGPDGTMHLRRDSAWIVPEPELTLAVSARGDVFGYTIGNDLSCRDIEGENPLYLPQAKVYAGCAALGPGILVTRRPMPRATVIRLDIRRRGRSVFTGETRVSEIRKPFSVLVEHLYRDNVFPSGCLLMTGTGIVPPGRFCLRRGDEVRITVEPIGTLVNRMD